MKPANKTYSISLNPNMEKDDIALAKKMLFCPHQWRQGRYLVKLTQAIKKDYHAVDAYLFNAGRSALTMALQSLDLKSGDEVLLATFTCIVNLNSILTAGLKPVLVDTQANLPNLDVDDLTQKITPRSKLLIVQHTFGYPVPMDQIKTICQKHKLYLIEDCAHSFTSRYHGQKIGTFGHMSFFSFGRDKPLSSVFGGALVVNEPKLRVKLEANYQRLAWPNLGWLWQINLYPLIMETVLKYYSVGKWGRFSWGKIILWLYQISGLLPYPVSQGEKANRPQFKPLKMSNLQAVMAWHQYQKKDKFRQKKAEFYQKWQSALTKLKLNFPLAKADTDLLRLPIFIKKANEFVNLAKQKNIYLGNWYRPVIAPQGSQINPAYYLPPNFPHAAQLSQQVVNLPLCPRFTRQEQNYLIKTICNLLKSYV